MDTHLHYEDVYPLFTAMKAGQLQSMFVFYYVVKYYLCFIVLYCVLRYSCQFHGDQIFLDFVKPHYE